MVRTVPYPRVGPRMDTNGLATRLLLIWDGPHRILATMHCEIQDRHDQEVHVVNVARLLRTFVINPSLWVPRLPPQPKQGH